MVVLLLVLLAGPVRAQEPSAPPLAVSRSPVGAWARYRTAHFGGSGGQDVRLALVARDARQAIWELSLAGPDGQPVVVALTFRRGGSGLTGTLQGRAVQIGGGQPMQLQLDPAGPAFRELKRDPRARREAVVVPAGRFHCQHHRMALDPGHGFDFWIAPGLFPTGVVRFEAWTRGGNGVRLVQETWELAARGRGARPAVTRPAASFDREAFARQFR